ncbi:hypothetical protein HPB50_004974 [Hyalomma asiaticum]|uniref:Uncharacterized protein n=1 Tax=Hyalomma asiaticum TaxID=266040 RepID=A0ACB7TCV9_HYAAI|nr:hypothetical protein HPB50_004974 [Hyalomma asiaticum]
MGPRRFVKTCNSGRKSCREKVTIFKAPNDPEHLQAWAAAIPRGGRQLTSKDCVCEKHFTSDMIRRDKYYGELQGEVTLDHPKRPRLLPDTVPNIFVPSPTSLIPPKKKHALQEASPKSSHDATKRSRMSLYDKPGMSLAATEPAANVSDVDNSRENTRESQVGRLHACAACEVNELEEHTVSAFTLRSHSMHWHQ